MLSQIWGKLIPFFMALLNFILDTWEAGYTHRSSMAQTNFWGHLWEILPKCYWLLRFPNLCNMFHNFIKQKLYY